MTDTLSTLDRFCIAAGAPNATHYAFADLFARHGVTLEWPSDADDLARLARAILNRVREGPDPDTATPLLTLASLASRASVAHILVSPGRGAARSAGAPSAAEVCEVAALMGAAQNGQ